MTRRTRNQIAEAKASCKRLVVVSKLRASFGNPNEDGIWKLYKVTPNDYPEDEHDKRKYIIQYRELCADNRMLTISNGNALKRAYTLEDIAISKRGMYLYDIKYKDGYLGLFTDEKHSDSYLLLNKEVDKEVKNEFGIKG